MTIPTLSLDGLAPTQAPGEAPAVGQVIPGSNVTGASGPTDFGSVLSQVANDAMNTLNAGEAAAISGLQGKASVQQVVKSVLDAQQAVQTVVAIRDKVVSAYQEVSRMAI
jgi:flagellar hook-basal body complex protein FliE